MAHDKLLAINIWDPDLIYLILKFSK